MDSCIQFDVHKQRKQEGKPNAGADNLKRLRRIQTAVAAEAGAEAIFITYDRHMVLRYWFYGNTVHSTYFFQSRTLSSKPRTFLFVPVLTFVTK